MIRQAVTIVMTCLLCAACATTGERQPRAPSIDDLLAQLTEQDGKACLTTGDITGYATLTDKIVSVDARSKRHYLVTTLYKCFSLDTAMGVAFTGSFSQVCGGTAKASINTREESCPIRHIYAFPSSEDALAAFEMARGRREAMRQLPGIQ